MTTKIPVELSSTPSIVDNGDATAITITSDEKVGIGTTSPTANLHVSGSSAQKIDITDTSAASTRISTANSKSYVGSTTNHPLLFLTNDTERMRISSDGNVGIGNAGPHQKLMVTGPIVLTGALSGLGAAGNYTHGALNGTALDYYGDNARSWSWGSATTRGTFTWYQLENDGQNQITSMMLDTGGNFLVGQTSLNYNVAGSSMGSGGLFRACVEGGLVAALNRRASDGVILNFYKNGTTVGSVSTNANSLPSDRNFKRDISDLDLGLNLVTKLKPSQYNYKVDDENSPKMYGLIAQDLEESLTEVGIEKNSAWLLQHNPKEDVNESDYSLDYTKLIPILINSIQELSAKVEELEGKIE